MSLDIIAATSFPELLLRIGEALKKVMQTDSLIPLGICLLVLLAVIFLRRKLASALLKLLLHHQRRRHARQTEAAQHKLQQPFSWWLTALTLRLLLPFMKFPSPADAMLSKLAQSWFFLTLFWVLYVLADQFCHQLNEIQKRPDNRLDKNAVNYISILLRTLVVVIAVLNVLGIWVANLYGLLTGLGIGGLVLALAAQDSAANLFASLSIMLDAPFAVGDWIEFADYSGSVEKVGLRSTRIRSGDQSAICVPNSTLGNAVIINGSKRRNRVVDFSLQLRCDSKPEQIRQFTAALTKLLTAEPEITGTPLVALETLDISGLSLKVRYLTSADFNQMESVRERINYQLLGLLSAYGLSLAATTGAALDPGKLLPTAAAAPAAVPSQQNASPATLASPQEASRLQEN
ncbi:mechanosensitive ion channel [Oscillospiraceae bacterium HV4-5-C5C]|nr:mechanosensitive ion channel [Oscillospiraceae bacterium HV4-5-C5C]